MHKFIGQKQKDYILKNNKLIKSIQKKIINPIFILLKQGNSPQQLSLAFSLGLILGIFPVIGFTSTLCFIAAVFFRLNLPAIQLANWLAFPLQIAFYIPFFKLSSFLFSIDHFEFNFNKFLTMMQEDWINTLKQCWQAHLYAISAWLAIALPMTFLLYYILNFSIKKFLRIVNSAA